MKNTNITPETPRRNTRSTKKGDNEWRCECGKLLFKGALLTGLLEVKCSRCKRMVYLQQFNSYAADNQSFMVTIKNDGTILTASPGIFEAIGYNQQDIIGTNFINYIDPIFYKAASFWMERIDNNSSDGGSYVSFVMPLKCKDKGEKMFSLLMRSTNLGGEDIYIVIGEAGLDSADSHDRKVLSKLAKKNREQRESWDFIINPEGKIIDSSGKSELGYEKDDLKGKSFFDLLDDQNKELKNKLKTQESFVLDLRLKLKSSSIEDYKVCFIPDFLAEPENPAFIVALRYEKTNGLV